MTPRGWLAPLLVAVLLSCAGPFHTRVWSGWRTSCPSETREIIVGADRYCIAPLGGPLEYVGMTRLGVFDGGRVFAVMPMAEHGVVGGVLAQSVSSVPDIVCRALPDGCQCNHEMYKAITDGLDGPRPYGLGLGGPPRCLRDDSTCRPEAFDRSRQREYQPDKLRIPVNPDARRRAAPCVFDGECVNSHCGYQCLSVRTIDPSESFLCLGDPKANALLADAFCGCVDGTCAWFAE